MRVAAALLWPVLGTPAGGALAAWMAPDPSGGRGIAFGALLGLALGSIACAMLIATMGDQWPDEIDGRPSGP